MKLRGCHGRASYGDLERGVENKHTVLIWALGDGGHLCLQACGEKFAGFQPQQDPGEPLARERHVGPALLGSSLLGRERERKKETRPGICSRVWQLLYFSP